jgi:GTP-binding protein EngB required for normal cell division
VDAGLPSGPFDSVGNQPEPSLLPDKPVVVVDVPAPELFAVKPPTDNINLCFVGGVSTGKSTLLNAIFCEELTQCKIKRTTMVPTIYIENAPDKDGHFANEITPAADIFVQIVEKNNMLIAKTECGEPPSQSDYAELVFNVGKLDINILPDALVNVYDIPGLNDARTKNIYYRYLEQNFHKFNLVVLLVDIHSGLNTSDELDIVQFVANSIREQRDKFKRNIYTMVIVNKADDMQLDETGKLMLTGELSEMFDQVEKTIHGEFDRREIAEHLVGIVPVCALDAYLYRMVQKRGRSFKLSPEQILKIGVNENGKKFSTLKPAVQETKVYEILEDSEFIQTMIQLSGFAAVERLLREFLSRDNTGNKLRVQNLLQELGQLPDMLDHVASTTPSEWDASVMEKTFAVLKRIADVDMEQYTEIMKSTVGTTVSRFLKHANDTTGFHTLFDYWRRFRVTFCRYFEDFFDFSVVPETVQQKAVRLAIDQVKSTYVLPVDFIRRIFSNLKAFDVFDLPTTETVMETMMERIEGANGRSYGSAKDAATEAQREEDFPALIAVLQEIRDLGVSNAFMQRFVRFLIIYRVITQQHDASVLMKRQWFYQMHGELLVYNWLLTRTCKLEYKGIEDLFIQGLRDNEFSEEEYLLDTYYVNLLK